MGTVWERAVQPSVFTLILTRYGGAEAMERATNPRDVVANGQCFMLSRRVYDAIGGGVGQTIGYIEGREAAQPFEQSPPIDAINAALIDEIFYNPMKPA